MGERKPPQTPSPFRSSPPLPLPLQAKLDLRARRNNRSLKGEVLAIVKEALEHDELHPLQTLTAEILHGY